MINAPIPRQKPGVLMQEAAGRVVLLDTVGGEYFAMDEVGGRIWSLCNGRQTVDEIAARICEEFDTDMNTARKDLDEFIEELVRERLLSIDA